ncbi:MAG: hypothetical protein K6F04_04330, partial [bacterium]|nr:hypothetical protein [bacterium]
NILSAHKNEEGVSAYITKLNEVRSAIDSLTDLTNADNVADYTKTITLGTEDTSLTEYATALEKKTEYETYRDGDFKTARDAYITAIKAVPTENYNNLLAEGVKVVADFMDDKIFNQSKDAYDVENIKSLSTAAKNDQASINDEKATYDAAYNTVDGKYTTAQNAVNAYNTAHENSVAYQKAHPTITSEAGIANIDWASVEGVKVAVANGSTEIDVLALRELYDSVRTAATENGKAEGVVDFAAYPASAETFVIKNNLELMAKADEPDYSDAQVGDNFYKDLVPGIQVQSHVAIFDSVDAKTVQKALVFADNDKKVDLSKTTYNLGEDTRINANQTYQGGIIGGVEFENLANTTISGTITGGSNISSFYEKFIKNTEAENLPTLALKVESVNIEETNLYGTNIDLVIAKYYNNSKTMSFTNNFGVFNAKEYLNGGSMYEENTYSNNAYNLDINAALVMNTDTSNVNITGVRSSSAPTELSMSLTNVRFASDLNGISLTGSQRGVIEFAGDAPDYIDKFGSRLVYSSVSRETKMNGAHSVDVSKLSVSAAANIKAVGTSDGITEVITNSEGAKPSNFAITRTVTSGTYSAQQWEKAGNQGKENPSEADLSYVLPSKNINQTRSDLIRAILDDNQKQYS